METLKKIGKIFLYILGGLVLLLFLAGLFIDPIAKKIMEDQAARAAEGQFSLALEEVDVSILGGDVSMKGVVLETDTTHPAAPPIVLLEAHEIAVEGVSWLTYLLSSKLSTDRVLLDDLKVELYAHTADSTKQEKKGPFRLQQLDIYPMIKSQIERFRLKDLRLSNISLSLVNLSSQDTLGFQSGELNLQSDNILVDADKLITDNRAFYATELDFEAKEVVVNRSGNKTLVVEGQYIKFETRDDNIGLRTEQVNFLQTGEREQDTLMSMELETFLLSNLRMKKIQEDSIGHLDKIELSNVTLTNNFPASPDTSSADDAAKPSPQINIAEMSLGESLPEFLKQIEVNQLDVNSMSYRQAKTIRLDDANVQAQNIVVNENAAFAQNRFLHASHVESSFSLLTLSSGEDSADVSAAGFKMDIEDGIGNILLGKFRMKPVEERKDEVWVDVGVGAFALTGLNTQRLRSYRLSIDSIGFQRPQVELNIPEVTKAMPALDLYPVIEGVLESVYLGKLAIIDAGIRAKGLMPGREKEVHIPTLYLQVSDINIAKGTAFSGDNVLHSDDIALRVEQIELPVAKVHTLNLDLFRLSTREEFIEAKDFILDYEGKRGSIPEDADSGSAMSVRSKLFRVEELDFQRLLEDNEAVAGLVKTDGLQLYMFVDDDKTSQGGNGEGDSEQESQSAEERSMPQEMIKEIEMAFSIQQLNMENANFIYEELAPGAEEAGEAKVSDISIVARNISNISTQIEADPILSISIEGTLMEAGDFETSLALDMLSDSNSAFVEGALDTMDITKMNRFTEFTSRLGFESGEIYHLGWKVEMDDEMSEGSLEMSYDDLKIQISESNNPSTSGILKNVGSFLANNLVLKSDVAPASSEEPKKATFREERDKEEAFPAYVMQGLISGFMELMLTIY